MPTPENPRPREREPQPEKPIIAAYRAARQIHEADPELRSEKHGRFYVNFSDAPDISGPYAVRVYSFSGNLSDDESLTHEISMPVIDEERGYAAQLHYYLRQGVVRINPRNLAEKNLERDLDEEFGPKVRRPNLVGDIEEVSPHGREEALRAGLEDIAARYEDMHTSGRDILGPEELATQLRRIKIVLASALPADSELNDTRSFEDMEYPELARHFAAAVNDLAKLTSYRSTWIESDDVYSVSTEVDADDNPKHIVFNHTAPAVLEPERSTMQDTTEHWAFEESGRVRYGTIEHVIPVSGEMGEADPEFLDLVAEHNLAQVQEQERRSLTGEDRATPEQIQAGLDLLRDPKHVRLISSARGVMDVPDFNLADFDFGDYGDNTPLGEQNPEIDWDGENGPDDPNPGPRNSL